MSGGCGEGHASRARRKRAEGSSWTTYLWDREQVVIEMNKNNVTQVRYTQAPRGYGDVVSQRRSGVSTYWHFDAIGSMRFLAAADQSKAINYVYDAFGITRSVSGTTTNRFRYIGKLGYYLEPALGCYYLRRRYYVHWLGRFLSKDPLRQGGENAYVYVRNAPTTATDASGRILSISDVIQDWLCKCLGVPAWLGSLWGLLTEALQPAETAPPWVDEWETPCARIWHNTRGQPDYLNPKSEEWYDLCIECCEWGYYDQPEWTVGRKPPGWHGHCAVQHWHNLQRDGYQHCAAFCVGGHKPPFLRNV
ncbi:MAG: RHS repeat-associated core domain-containing protein [Armatimonadetes bacterium]|nr:RHS repeat-associated core domain-containing protein [Armatimonadota bacterium]